tara:strand:+ start:277 stop:432 length:156 start_codon:yes stop_codon:yes gene_type:complete
LILATDHVIQDEASFTKIVEGTIPLAQSGKLEASGIVAAHTNTGYIYIRKG